MCMTDGTSTPIWMCLTGWNIDPDMDVFEGPNINPDIDPNVAEWNIDLNMDLSTNNQKRDEELLPISPAHAKLS